MGILARRRRIVGVVAALALLPTSFVTLVVDDVAHASEADDVGGMTSGLHSLTAALVGLAPIEALSTPIPFTGTSPAELLGLRAMIEKLDARIVAATATSATQLEAFLNDPDGNGDPAVDGEVAGRTLDVRATVSSTAPYALSMTLDFGGDALSLPFVLGSADNNGDHIPDTYLDATFSVDVDASLAFAATYDPAKAAAHRFNVSTGGGTLQFAATANVSSGALNIGVLDAAASGNLTVSGTAAITLVDPDHFGGITDTELTTTDAADLFDANFTNFAASGSFDVSASVGGIGTVPATIAVTGSSPETVTATFSLGALADFQNASPLDIISALAQFASSLGAMQNGGLADVDLPFTNQTLGDVFDLAQGIKRFLIDNHITTADNPLSPGSNTEFLSHLAEFDTIGEVADLLASALGTADVPVSYDPATKRLRFGISQTISGDVAVTPDLGDEVASLGIVGIDTGASTAKLTPSATIDMTLGIDLGMPTSSALADRVFLDATTDGPEVAIDLPLSVNVDMGATIGFVGLQLTDSNTSGMINVLAKRAGDAAPMLALDLADGSVHDGVLTLTELFDALGSSNLAAAGALAINAAVPSTTITATALSGSTTLATGTFTIAWPDITAGTPAVSGDTDFNTKLLDFGFDASNPQQLLNQVLDALQALIGTFQTTIAATPLLNTPLPLIGTSFQQIADRFNQLRDSVNSVTADPSRTLQSFETQLESLLGGALGIDQAAWPSLLTFTLDSSGPKTVILASLDLGVCSTAGNGCTAVVPLQKGLNLDLGASDLVGVSGGGEIQIDYAAMLNLDLGVELPEVTPGVPPSASGMLTPFVLDSTQVSLAVGADASTTLQAYLGPVTAGLGQDGNPVVAKLGATFQIANPNYGSGSGVDRVALADLNTFLAGAIPSTIAPSTPVSCDGGTTTGAACASIPVYFPAGTLLGTITFLAPDLMDPAGWTFGGVQAVLDQLVAQAWDFTTLMKGLEAVLEQIRVATDGKSFGAKVPILGDALDAGAAIADKFNTSVVQPINSILAQLNAAADAQAIADLIDTTLTNAILSDLLVDRNGNGDNADDITVTAMCNDGAGGQQPCAAGSLVTSVVDIAVELSLGASVSNAIAFDLGIPGLSLRVKDDPNNPNDTLMATASWQLDLAFGINRTAGFYLRTDNPIRGATAGELSLSVGLDLPDDVFGTLAFIPMRLTDTHAGNDLNTTLGVDLSTTTGNTLSLGQLLAGLDPGVGLGLTIGGNVELHLGFLTGLSPTEVQQFGTDAPKLPVFHGTLNLVWALGGGDGSTPRDITAFANDTNGLQISLTDVTLNVGSFFGGFLGSITKELDRFARPLKPVLDVLSAPIPGVKEIAELVGATPPTLLDLIELQNGPGSTALIRRLIMLVDFIVAVNDGANAGDIPIGDLIVRSDVALRSPLTGTQADQLIDQVIPDSLQKPIDAIKAKVGGALSDKLGTAQSDGGFSFPAFDDPAKLLGLLIGKDVDLVRFDAGKLEAGISKTFKFGPPIGPIPVSVGITVSFKVTGHLEIGYDTLGIRKAISILTDDDPNNDGLFGTVATLLQGVYLDDNKDGVDVPEISLVGGVSVQAALDVLVLEAGVRGGVKATLDLNLHDGGPIGEPAKPEDLDGKLRIEEIIRAFAKNPMCLFDTSGALTVFLELYESNIITGEDTWPLANATLVDFSGLFDSLCNTPPEPAHLEGDGVLVLNIGPYASQRGVQTDEKNETVTVRQTGPDTVSVTVLGSEKTYSGVKRILADGGDGNDSITMLAGGTATVNNGALSSNVSLFTLPTELCGGPGNDHLTGGDGVDHILGDGRRQAGTFVCEAVGGDGNDSITGGAGADTIDGMGGNDTIGGGNDADTIFASAGADTVNGGAADDEIHGGDGDDNLVGGDGNDRMYGDADNDTISGGAGDDTIEGNGGNDLVDGAAGGDTVSGGDGDDALHGGDGADTIHGDGGSDDIFGDGGADHLFGDAGNDDVIGGADGDEISGGDGRDYLIGDDGTIDRAPGSVDGAIAAGTAVSGADTMSGDGGDDVMFGGRGADTMHGNADNDAMYGGADDDVMFGDDGSDAMFGDAGNDTMHGGAHDDWMRGGAGDDAMFGDAGNDTIFGDSGADSIEGGDDADTVYGGIGGDCAAGNGGDDTLSGDAGDDRMTGGSAQSGQLDGADTMDGGVGDDVMTGDNADVCNGHLVIHDQPFLSELTLPSDSWSGSDSMRGGEGNDVMYGQGKDETMIAGDGGDDYIEGNAGNDGIAGGDGADDLIGGSGHDLGNAGALRLFPNVADGADVIYGGAGIDHIAGDNADLRRLPTRTIELFDVRFIGASVDDRAGDADEIHGGYGADVAYGQDGDDHIEGDAGDDYLEGNSGADVITGDGGQDDIVGGSGRDDGPHTAPDTFRRLTNVADDGDALDGGDDQDVILGDNGSIVRPAVGPGLFATVVRDVELYDVERAGEPAVSADVSGDENPIVGGEGNDTIFAQGGSDLVLAGDGEDYVEGNHGADTLYGGAGQDDLIGGGSANDGIIDADRVGDGLLDGDDLIAGDATSADDATNEGAADDNGADVTMGDNARVIKLVNAAGTDWQIDEGTLDIVRAIVQFDVEPVTKAPAPDVVHGDDVLYGNGNDDVMRGQGGSDHAYGGAGDDDIEGNPGTDYLYGQSGQDDMIGGSRVAARRDAGDFLYGGADADVQLGDNGLIVREVTGHGQYRMYVEANPTTIVRTTTRFDVAGNPLAFGGDLLSGEGGDDYQWGQDGDDTLYGNDGNDDMLGELGADRMYGGTGEDAMLGDRGGIVDRLIDGSPGDPAPLLVKLNSPPAESFTGFRPGTLDRRVDMLRDPASTGTGFSTVKLAMPGTTAGGADLMLGGPGRDSMHGGFGDDVMNGESGGDALFGDHGADAMWGGKGCDPAIDGAVACPDLATRGPNDIYVDYLFGGYGGPPGSKAEAAADILDYRPRPGIDPAIWFEATSTADADDSDNQHHQGVDWIYGGWDRDVMEANVAGNGPNPGDRLIDWPGATQLFLHCNAAYGGFNDIRQQSPAMQDFLLKLAYSLGAGPTLADMQTSGSSGFVDVAMVYSKDIKSNNGPAFTGTPGHYEQFSCAP